MDRRLEQLDGWCARKLGTPHVELAPASADASFRRYFRVHAGYDTFIAMDAPPEHGDQTPFVRVAALMRDAGIHAPEVHAIDLERGFLLLEDLGRHTYLQALDEANADDLMAGAIDALVRWQSATRPRELPPYDRALLRDELMLFPDWYLERHMGIGLDDAQRSELSEVFRLLEDNALDQPQVYVHRDYMPRNLMLSRPNPGVIDFQDAVTGPITYDVVSLIRDAFLSWPEAHEDAWIRHYAERAAAAGLPVEPGDTAFRRSLDLMGVQRHLKIIGIFARLHYRDGKAGYLADTPRFFRYIRRVAPAYRELRPLLALLDATGAEAAAAEPAA